MRDNPYPIEEGSCSNTRPREKVVFGSFLDQVVDQLLFAGDKHANSSAAYCPGIQSELGRDEAFDSCSNSSIYQEVLTANCSRRNGGNYGVLPNQSLRKIGRGTEVVDLLDRDTSWKFGA